MLLLSHLFEPSLGLLILGRIMAHSGMQPAIGRLEAARLASFPQIPWKSNPNNLRTQNHSVPGVSFISPGRNQAGGAEDVGVGVATQPSSASSQARQIARAELWLPPSLTEIATTLQTGHWIQIWEVPFPRADMPTSVTRALYSQGRSPYKA